MLRAPFPAGSWARTNPRRHLRGVRKVGEELQPCLCPDIHLHRACGGPRGPTLREEDLSPPASLLQPLWLLGQGSGHLSDEGGQPPGGIPRGRAMRGQPGLRSAFRTPSGSHCTPPFFATCLPSGLRLRVRCASSSCWLLVGWTPCSVSLPWFSTFC